MINLPQEALEYLNSQRLMSIATFDNEPWIASVYFVIDDDLNLYFISSPKTKHAQAIKSNPKVAVSIAASSQLITDKKVGVQITGTASEVGRIESIQWFFKMFNKLNPGLSEILNFDNYTKKVISSRVFKVEPKKIQFFHEGLYEDSEVEATMMFE